MSKSRNKIIRRWMYSVLMTEPEEYIDECGFLRATKLAEDCCDDLDEYAGIDFEISEIFFEESLAAGIWAKIPLPGDRC